jgi:L-malate glycosyltransferase
MGTILHITPHMGGGVGKALLGLIEQSVQSKSNFKHNIICLEQPQKYQFIDKVIEIGGQIKFCPSDSEFCELIEETDIVQLEFWNHPATLQALCSQSLPAMRLLVWCHISGLHYPSIPKKLLTNAHKFLFTSPCSYESSEVKELNASIQASQLGIVSSGGGLDVLSQPSHISYNSLNVGYIGSLNFSKLHPDFVTFLAAVKKQKTWFKVRLIGDETNRDILEKQSHSLGYSDLLEFRGYSTDIVKELKELDVLLYLLNPTHYGTAENALLEAMAMGIVPIVLDNPAERCIVENYQTGIIIHNTEELVNAIDWLVAHPEERINIRKRAAEKVRKHYTYQQTENAFNHYYEQLMQHSKAMINFTDIFGREPSDWFCAFFRDTSIFQGTGVVQIPNDLSRYALLERTKGSVFHFLDYFPDSVKLKSWAKNTT